MLLLCYPKCSTCMKAKKWLEEKEIEELRNQISNLETTNKSLIEALQYVSTIIGWFATLSTQEKIANISKITQDLRNTIFSCIKN